MRVALAAIALCLCLPALPVLAQDAAPNAAGEDGEEEEAERVEHPHASEYVVKVQDAIRRAKNRDFEAAFEVLRDAFRMEPSNAMAFYFAAEIARMQGNLPDAMERFRTCVEFAGRNDDDRYHARCLQGIADTFERTDGQLEAARAAWATYVEFADSHRQVSHPEMGRERLSAIDAQMEQAGAYVAVRQRIAQREQENAQNRGQSQRRQRGQERPRMRRAQ